MEPGNDKQKLLIENLPDAFAYHRIVTDSQGKPVDYIFLEVNQAFEEMTVLNRDKIIDKKVTEVLPDIEKSDFDWIGTYGQVALSGEPIRFESFYESLGRWYAVSAYSDKPGYFATSFHDITITKRIERQLIDSEKKYLSMFEQFALGVYLHDLEGNIVDINQEACAQLGYKKEELLEMSVFDLHPQDENTINMPKEEILKAWSKWQPGDRHVHEAQHQRKNGSVITVQVTTGIVKYDDKKMLLAMIQDITDRKQAEEKLEQEKSEKELILSNLAEQVAFLDLEMRITWANSKVIEGHNLKNVEYKGKKCYEVYHQLSEPCPDCPIIDVLKTGVGSSGIHRSPDGTYWQMVGTPVFDKDGKMIGVLDTALDISDLKAIEEEMKELNVNLERKVEERTAQLEAANRELDAFTHSASHDLRSPLNRISGFSNALLEDFSDQLDSQSRDYLQRINSSCEHMKLLIDDLLKLSRVSQVQISREPVELSALANVCLKELKARVPDRPVETVIASDLVVEGDTALLRIALENLLGNAWKFSAGEVPSRIEFGSTFQEGKEVYYIRDNGTGFDMKHAEKLFTAFQRLHDAKKYPGTGIGLSIVSRIINRHGGEIWAEGEPGKGACFYFTLP